MNETFNIVADAIAEEFSVPRDTITMDSNVVDDLGLDSLAFLELCYAIDTKLGIKTPFEEWVNAVNSGKVSSQDIFQVKYIVAEIDKLVAKKKDLHRI
jgi:acyl carrier protein